MKTSKTIVTPTALPGTYVDAHGATIQIPAGSAADYANVKAELLGALSRLLCDVGEGDVELSAIDVSTFRWTLNALVHEMRELVDVVKNDAAGSTKGGA